MKRTAVFFLASLAILSFVFSGIGGAADIAKIGVFDYQKFMVNSKGGQNIREILNTKKTQLEGKLKEKAGEIKKLGDQLEREAFVMSPEKQGEKQREYRIQVNDYKDMDEMYAKEIKRAEREETKKIFDQVDEILKKIGKEENFLLILPQSTVLYSPDQLDITDRVIKLHDKQF
ncbi:MAG: OmpH family outer membrane protein [Desulforegulaceae bacterium]|nr:OmpH family outer membrane protein [Desulforegulaceae bacterium]